MNRPLHDAKERREVMRARTQSDTIEWLVKNVAKNKRTSGIGDFVRRIPGGDGDGEPAPGAEAGFPTGVHGRRVMGDDFSTVERSG